MSKKVDNNRIISKNRSALYNFFIEDVFEAGIILKSSEVKSIRAGRINISDAFAEIKNEEIFLMGAYIAEYKEATRFNHHPLRPRKLLLHTKEIKKLIGKLKKKGYTLAPLKIYFNKKNIIKLELGLAIGKKSYDKRAAVKEREWNIDKQRILKNS